jgi:hypothetical protein
MSTVWEVPVAPAGAMLSRRMLREVQDAMPRDPRPSRARRERLPEALRVWGAVSRRAPVEQT